MTTYVPWQEDARRWAAIDRRLGLPDNERLRQVAREIERTKRHLADTRVLGPDYRYVGLVGKRQFAREFGLPWSPTVLARGTRRVDFRLPQSGLTVNVQTARRLTAGRIRDLRLTAGAKGAVDVMVLAVDDELTETAELWGWAEEAAVRARPALPLANRDRVRVHVYDHRWLRSLSELRQREGIEAAQLQLFGA